MDLHVDDFESVFEKALAAGATCEQVHKISGYPPVAFRSPDGHFNFPHLWPVIFPRAGPLDYGLLGLLMVMRDAASLSL